MAIRHVEQRTEKRMSFRVSRRITYRSFSACPGKGLRLREWGLVIDRGGAAADNTTALSSYCAGAGPCTSSVRTAIARSSALKFRRPKQYAARTVARSFAQSQTRRD